LQKLLTGQIRVKAVGRLRCLTFNPALIIESVGDYLTSDARKRRRIIEAEKEPQDLSVNWYELAQSKIVEFYHIGL
jgi:hypothetical protein